MLIIMGWKLRIHNNDNMAILMMWYEFENFQADPMFLTF